MDLQSRARWPLAAFILMTAGYWSSFLIPAGSRGKKERGVTRSNGQDLLPHIFTDSNTFVDLVAHAFISHLQTKKIYIWKNKSALLENTQIACELYTWMVIPIEEVPAVHSRGGGAEGVSSCALPPHFLCLPIWSPVQQQQNPCTFPTKAFFFLHDGVFIVWFCIYSCCWKAQSITKTQKANPATINETLDWNLLSELTGRSCT